MSVSAARAVWLYRALLAPILAALAGVVPGGGCCKYAPSCSHYAAEAFRQYGILRGSVLAAWRLLRCNPWSHGGVDHVSDQRLFAHRPPRAGTREART